MPDADENGMERASDNNLRPDIKPQEAREGALCRKIGHWAEMALLINNEFAPMPVGFGYIVKDARLVCGYVDRFDRDSGDALTPPGEAAIFNTIEMPFSASTTAAEVYVYIQRAVELAADRWSAIEEEKSLWA
ncbi:hypothetical protein [Emticicia sp. TH156]|uniref:hypothetical protein n=1 Tax=Emticicia sp. TH156 TaxID=2067454 RepID=UPI00117EBCEB|nr:hypothetical protein [Emticicia sp. TH156]